MPQTPKTRADTSRAGPRPNPPERALLPNPVARALPRVLGVAAGMGMFVHWEFVGGLLLMWSLPYHPRAWWRYVRTGLIPQPPTDGKYLNTGTWRVDLVGPQQVTFDMVRAVREVTGLSVEGARALLEQGGSVAEGLSVGSAARVCARLEQAGLTVTPADTGVTSDPKQPDR